jgi:hypothetical protein
MKWPNVKRPPCPGCGEQDQAIPYIWGWPPIDADEIEQRENVKFANGCVVFKDSPNWYCKRCEKNFLARDFRTGYDFWFKPYDEGRA